MQNDRIHAFVPGTLAGKNEYDVIVGKVYSIFNFSVKEYRAEEKFRCIQSNKQIIFTTYTKVKEIDDNGTFIEQNMFDFFDLSDLKQMANKNVYLTGTLLNSI